MKIITDPEHPLVKTQLALWPGSTIHTHTEVFDWLNHSPQFKRLDADRYEDDQSIVERDLRIRLQYAEHFRSIAHAVAFALLFQDEGVFYTLDDGKTRGMRFGLEGYQYLSGFPGPNGEM